MFVFFCLATGENDEAKTDERKENGEDNDKNSSSDDDDDLTVTIGEVKKQSDIIQDIIQPTAHQARFQPKVINFDSY